MRLLGRYQGRNGQIEIVECSWDGTRVYFEEGVRQSQATPDGESVFTYVKIMDELLSRSEHILVLGCGGGNLATRLSRLGKRLTIVDINPISFVLAHRYFDLPDDLPCIVSDFRKFVFDDRAYYDGIAIDVGGPGFRFTEEFDAETCDAIRARLAPGGRIVMNVMVADDIDPTPDRIAVKLADLLLDGSARFEQRSDRSYQLRAPLDQLLGSHGEDIELGTADDETEVLEKATDMVLKIALDLDQQRPAGQ